MPWYDSMVNSLRHDITLAYCAESAVKLQSINQSIAWYMSVHNEYNRESHESFYILWRRVCISDSHNNIIGVFRVFERRKDNNYNNSATVDKANIFCGGLINTVGVPHKCHRSDVYFTRRVCIQSYLQSVFSSTNSKIFVRGQHSIRHSAYTVVNCILVSLSYALVSPRICRFKALATGLEHKQLTAIITAKSLS